MGVRGETVLAAVESLDPFSPEGLAARARERLSLEVPADAFAPGFVPQAGDHVLAPGAEPGQGVRHRPAAVLVPVVAHPGGATVLLTRRAAHLREHSGQVAFPGGKIDASDPSPLETALREADEEIGLDRARIQPLGYLPPYLSSTGFRILPVVSLVEPGFTLALNPGEVDAAFEVPLAFLMTEANHERHAREWKGSLRHYYAMPYGEHYVWGVTAGILRTMYERLYAP
jgi:8-oxo-dGTP pyrophosphatase MutT (NUDIX family)